MRRSRSRSEDQVDSSRGKVVTKRLIYLRGFVIVHSTSGLHTARVVVMTKEMIWTIAKRIDIRGPTQRTCRCSWKHIPCLSAIPIMEISGATDGPSLPKGVPCLHERPR